MGKRSVCAFDGVIMGMAHRSCCLTVSVAAKRDRPCGDAQEDLNILGPIGEGAFGAVSLAHSPVFGKVATKWLKPGKVSRCLCRLVTAELSTLSIPSRCSG